MKKKYYNLIFVLMTILISCEEVVQVELEETNSRLVVEGSLFLDKDNPISTQIIKLSTTAPFFDEEIPPAVGARVLVYDDKGNTFIFFEIDPGLYRAQNLTPEFDTQYFLEIVYEGEVYTAKESLIAVPELQNVDQNDNGGFTGDNIELKIFYTDFPEPGNYYLFRFLNENLSIQIYDDKFTNGNQTFGFFSDEDISQGDVVNFEIQGISQRFYEYMFILRSQAGTGGGPFQTQPTTVRGNLVNTTNPDNFALGYFRLSEKDNLIYTVQ